MRVHVTDIDYNEVRRMYRATCRCGWQGILRITEARGKVSADLHKAREASKLAFPSLAVSR